MGGGACRARALARPPASSLRPSSLLTWVHHDAAYRPDAHCSRSVTALGDWAATSASASERSLPIAGAPAAARSARGLAAPGTAAASAPAPIDLADAGAPPTASVTGGRSR